MEGSMARVVGPRTERGASLLEALVAVLVLSFGLLGAAAMQLQAMQSAHASYQRSIAILAARDAVERLWVALDGSAPGECPSPGADGLEAEWIEHWRGALAGMEAESAIVSRAACRYVLHVAWRDARFPGESVSRLTFAVALPGAVP